MIRIRASRLPAALLLLALVSCGGSEAEGSPADPAVDPRAAAPDRPAGAGRAATDSIEVTLGGRHFAGTHRAAGELGCTMYGGIWQASYEVPADSGLSGLLVQLKEVPAKGGSTDRLTLSLVFGQMDDMSGNAGMVDVVGSEYGGDARGTVTREGGEGAVIRVEGTTRDGSRAEAVLRCATVSLLQ